MILIDMKMPKDGRPHKALVILNPDGTASAVVEYSKSYSDRHIETFQVIELLPHSELIERSAVSLSDFQIAMCSSYEDLTKMLLQKIKDAPTVIPANKEENNGEC